MKEAVPVLSELLVGASVDSVDSKSWIVFRNANHRWLAGCSSTDLKYTYSSVQLAPERHHFRLFNAKGITPVLTYCDQAVIGEKREGKGNWIICSLELSGKLDTTPVLTRLIERILERK